MNSHSRFRFLPHVAVGIALFTLLLSTGCRTSRNCDADGNGEASKAMLRDYGA